LNTASGRLQGGAKGLKSRRCRCNARDKNKNCARGNFHAS